MNLSVVEDAHRSLTDFLTRKFSQITSLDHKDVLAGGLAAHTITGWCVENQRVDDELFGVFNDVYNALCKLRYDTENRLPVVRRDIVVGLCDIMSPVYLAMVFEQSLESGVFNV